MKPLRFSKDTFTYFEQARQNENSRAWFDSHKQEYADCVLVPFSHLIVQMKERLSVLLPGFEFSPKKIVKPVRRQVEGLEEPVVRSKTTAFFSEAATSIFESNPGIYISLGASVEDNVYGIGLYDVSNRQMKMLRAAYLSDTAAVDACVKSRPVMDRWGGLSGERFQRFPKSYEETGLGAEYLWHKQAFLSKTFTRASATKDAFPETLIEDLEASIPFLQWLRSTVGIYRKEAN